MDIPAGPVNVELPMIEFNGNSGNYDDKIIIIIIIIIGGMIYTAVQGVTDSAIPASAHISFRRPATFMGHSVQMRVLWTAI